VSASSDVTQRVQAPGSDEGDVVIRFVDLWKAFGPKKIYEGLDLEDRKSVV
jgi:hypothetical protein